MRRYHVIFFLHTDNLMGNFRHGAQREFLTRKMLNISPLVGLFCMMLAIYATKCQGHPALDCIRCIYESLRYISMGIVKISDLLHDDIRDASKAMSRSVNARRNTGSVWA